MKPTLSAMLLTVLTAVPAVVLWNLDSMLSTSIDMAHHYALAQRFVEQWRLSPLKDPSLGGMESYPRISHIIAAVIGTLIESGGELPLV